MLHSTSALVNHPAVIIVIPGYNWGLWQQLPEHMHISPICRAGAAVPGKDGLNVLRKGKGFIAVPAYEGSLAEAQRDACNQT
eukprot:1156796-Pelagomonas_calceolata.AAC.1